MTYGFKSIFIVIIALLILLLSQSIYQFLLFWASYWSKQTVQDSAFLIEGMGILVLIYYLSVCLRMFLFINLSLRSNVGVHNKAIESVITTSSSFFDTNPTGQIISRFAKDIGVIDGSLQYYLYETASTSTTLLGNFGVTVFVIPYNLIILPVLVLIAYPILKYVSPITLKLRKLELIARGPLLSTLNSAMNGLPILRCLCIQNKFKSDIREHATNHYRSSLTYHIFLRFSQFYADMVSVLIVVLNVAILVFTKGQIDPALAAYSLATSAYLQGLNALVIRNWLELESGMASAQRLLDYTDLPQEGVFTRPERFLIKEGHIQFDNVFMRYRPELPHSLSGLSFTVQAGHKVGIVGRTGAGKSSVLQVLFRLVNPESGSVLIDGRDYGDLGLHDLRKQMSVIPQSAILFSTTVRENLDPFREHTDLELNSVLEEFKLKEAIFEHVNGLDAEVSGKGVSLSAGQKQLLCLARAVLRQNKIIMMDEATANVDNETDRIIQKTVKLRFSGCTLLVIAHRIRTIIESDMIIVMDKGVCKEYGSPVELYGNQESLFRNLIQQSGVKESDYLVKKLSS